MRLKISRTGAAALLAALFFQLTHATTVVAAPRAGDPLVLGDDGSIELSMPFAFQICGESFNSLFVNSNGNLTFGAPDDGFMSSLVDIGEFLAGPPRIAGLWDDLNPASGGTVTFQERKNRFSVIFDGVPEFPATGANSFSIELKRSANHIDIDYGEMTAADGLAGVSCGGAVTSGFETPTDLSAQEEPINLHNQPAAFEHFTAANLVDLGGNGLRFTGTTNYEDNWAEPNDSFAQARAISLPFNSTSVRRFTEIEPVGGDVDFYRFQATGGLTLMLEVVSGELDSLLGLFDRDGNRVALDDDGGEGTRSRIMFPVPVDGEYYLAVTTNPDRGFTGAGDSGGRYVLDLSMVESALLPMGDDDSVEVPLPFSFPFQGSSYDSVFINANGHLTFGAPHDGSMSWAEDVATFLSGPPRIAALWDDLSPNAAGRVFIEPAPAFVTITFDGVPEWPGTGSNTFSVVLWDNGTVEISYGELESDDNLVGVTEGGRRPDPGASDLSSSPTWPGNGTTYELFGVGSPQDLEGKTIVFDP